MCFSAAASFGAAAVISTIGVISFKKADKSPTRLLAIIPLFFGIQQFAEGIIWMALQYEIFSPLITLSTNFYLLIAWIVWPTYIPFALWKLEQNIIRKKILLILFFIGILVIPVFLYILLFQEVNAQIQDCSILYAFNDKHTYSWVIGVFYLMSTTISTLVSSIGKMWGLGTINLLSYLFTKIYYNEHVISVWCFFAAISSILLLWIILNEGFKESIDD